VPLLLCALLAVGAAAAHGQSREAAGAARAEPRGELTLAQAVELALARNPELAASAFDTLAAEARVEQARLQVNPDLSVELENFAGTGVARGTQALETTLTLSQVVELGGKRALRTEVAASDRDLTQVERRAQQLDVLAEVTRRFIAVVAAQERAVLASSAKDITQRTLDAISKRVEAARSPEAERSRARIAHTRASIEEQQAQSELRAARFALSALWGARLDSYSQDAAIPAATQPIVPASSGTDRTAFTTARGDLMSLDPTQPYDALIARLERNPDFLRFASEARLRDAELQLARAQARPNLAFGGGVRRLNESSDTALVATFSISLPAFDRNQGAIRAAEARRQQTTAARDAAFIRARATIYGLYQELSASRSRVETLRAEALPQAERALQETEYGYQRGRFSYLELATAQRDQLELKGALIDGAADYHRILAEIERLTGEALTP
jgi:cobalt-zinc-cadmium efflux system outer membrane protein